MTNPALSTLTDHRPVVLSETPRRVGSVTLVVRDLEEVIDFYQWIIGLELIDRGARHARLGVGGKVLVHLRSEPGARPRDPRDAGLFHTAFLLPERADLGAWLSAAAAQGVRLTGAADHLVSEAVYLNDPEGNGVEIYVDRPSSHWLRTDGMIEMTTDPLDLHRLVAAAADRPWRGFPEQGVVGHVHLQVGDTARAEAFWQGPMGFDVTWRYRGGSFFGSGGYHHQLAANTWNSRGAGVRDDQAAGLAEVELIVHPEILEAVRAEASRDDAETLVIRDPWGLSVALRSD